MPSFELPTTVVVVAASVAAFFFFLVPTLTYLYVEPRGRRHWLDQGEGRGRKAPAFVRLTAWLSFAVGQVAIPWMLIPLACAALIYVQSQLAVKPIGLAIMAAAGIIGLAQAILAFRLFALGVRLLLRDERAQTTAKARATRNTLAGLVALGVVSGAGALLTASPGLMNQWLRVVFDWVALRPIAVLGAASLLHGLLLGRCANVLVARPSAGDIEGKG
jgi:hypothetical protein